MCILEDMVLKLDRVYYKRSACHVLQYDNILVVYLSAIYIHTSKYAVSLQVYSYITYPKNTMVISTNHPFCLLQTPIHT